jgi:glycosyltransferase involved in cell wall biosynthesis
VVGDLAVGGAAKYSIDLCQSLSRFMKTVIVATEVDEKTLETQVGEWNLRYPEFVNAVSFTSFADPHARNAYTLALLIKRLKPSMVFIVNSRLGYKAVERFGLGISTYTSIFSVFFSQSPSLIGRPHAARFLESSAQVGTIISDNQRFLDEQGLRLGTIAKQRAKVMPPLSKPFSKEDFEVGVSRRRNSHLDGGSPKLLWLGRWDAHKDYHLIEQLARDCPEIEIHVFYTLTLNGPRPSSTNVNLKFFKSGTNLGGIDTSRYSAFLFTSLYEGMPNTVLEMADLGIPIVAADVGGLRETFSEKSLEFYNVIGDSAERYDSLKQAVLSTLELSWEEIEMRLRAARELVNTNHSQRVFDSHVEALVRSAREEGGWKP